MADARRGPLSGVTVIDLTRVLAGPWCCQVLYNLGARVIKVDSPGADPTTNDPYNNATCNSGKESILLDWMKSEADRKVLERLLDTADVLVENYRAGVMKSCGLGWDVVHARWPRLVMCSISGYGQSGPNMGRAAMDVVIQGSSGIMALSGSGDQPTTLEGMADINAGLHAALGIQSALISRHTDGEGRYVDIAMQDCAMSLTQTNLAVYNRTKKEPERLGVRIRGLAPFDAFKTKDKLMCLIAYQQKHWERVCELLGRPDLIKRPEFKTNRDRINVENNRKLKQEFEAALAAKTRDEWMEIFLAEGLGCGPVNGMGDVVADLQLAHRNMITTVKDAKGREFMVPGNPIKVSGFADLPKERTLVAPNADSERIRSSL